MTALLQGVSAVQVGWDIAGFAAATVSGIFTVTRRHMLSDALARWHSAGGVVQASLAVQAIYMGCTALSILFGAHVGQRETGLLVMSALVSVVMVVNLDRTGRRPAEDAPAR